MMKYQYVIPIILTCMLSSTASANNVDPRISYQIQTCHHSTAPIVKMALKKASQSEARFCECIAEKAVSNNVQTDDHAYALAYHEMNIVLERLKRYKQSETAIVNEMSKRTKSYEDNYGITFEKLTQLTKPALETVLNCKDLTVPQIRNRFTSKLP